MLFLLRLAARLPLPLLHALGAALGWIVYLSSPRYRSDLRRGLETAGLSDLRLRRAAVAEAGKGVLEAPAVWLRPLRQVADLVVEVSGWEHVEDGAKRGKGVMIVTPHIGCWEIVGQYVASRMPITVMYSPPKVRALEAGRPERRRCCAARSACPGAAVTASSSSRCSRRGRPSRRRARSTARSSR